VALGGQFRRLWVASALSNLADGVFQVALPLLAVTLTKSPALVAGVALAQRLPWLVMALPAGALADRLDRRRTMVRVDALRVIVMGALAAAVGLDAASMPVLYAAAVVLGVGETLFDTAAQSILPSLVDRSQLSAANGRLQAVELTANQFVGPPLGGVLAAAALASAFAVSSGAYLLAALVLVAIAGSFRPERVVDGGRAGRAPSMRADIAEGVRFVWRNAVLRTLALMLGVTNLAFTAFFAVFVLYAVRPGPMGLSKAGYGLFLTASAVGGVVGSWLGPRLERALGRARCLFVAITLFGASLAVPAITASVAANATAFALEGVWSVVWNVITVSLRQRITPDHLLGRMNSTYRLLGWGTMPIGAALGGAVAEWAGLRVTFAAAALVHLPLLLGFLVVTERRIVEAEAAYTPNLSA
jgi:MFS family permease